MPKKIVTKVNWNNGKNDSAVALANISNAIAESIGSVATKENDKYKISFASLGYPNFELVLNATSNNRLDGSFVCLDINNGPAIYSPGMFLPLFTGTSNVYPASNGYTAVCVRDSNNDSVVISVVPGQRADSIEGVISDARMLLLFIGRDADNNVLYCSGSNGHITNVFWNGGTYVVSPNLSDIEPQITTNVLHLTKMVNYLAPGAPEMKSAYISIARPYSDNIGSTGKNQSYYVDGDVWFIPGDSQNLKGLYYPIDPIIKGD